jgi:hypothetical protein
MSIRSARIAWTAAGAILVASTALAQTTSASKDDQGAKGTPTTTTLPRTKPVRKPVVDLEKMAKERRPGQVMPGDPAPVVPPKAPSGEGTIPEATPAVAPPSNGTIQLPDTSPPPKPALKPTTEAPASPVSTAMPATTTPAAESMAPSPMSATDLDTPHAAAPAGMTAEPTAATAATTPAATTPATPMAEVAPAPPPQAPMPAAEPAPAMDASYGRAEPLPHVEAAPKHESAAPKTEVAESGDTIGGVGIVDKYIVTAMPMPMSTGSAKVRIESISGDASDVQWRASGESWRTPAAGDTAESRIEIRAGLDAEMTLVVDDHVEVRIGRLGRALIERAMEPGGGSTMSITLSRGAAEIRPAGAGESAPGVMFARVKTPDQVFGLTGPLRVEYDAFTGTRRRTLNP